MRKRLSATGQGHVESETSSLLLLYPVAGGRLETPAVSVTKRSWRPSSSRSRDPPTFDHGNGTGSSLRSTRLRIQVRPLASLICAAHQADAVPMIRAGVRGVSEDTSAPTFDLSAAGRGPIVGQAAPGLEGLRGAEPA